MAALVFMALLLAMAGHSSASWCVCKDGIAETVLQKTLDYACGAGADCNPTHQNAPCFQPNTVRAHCSYAVNSYFQRNRQQPTACDFSGTAVISNSDPSTAGCSYPATASSATTTTTPAGTTTSVPGTAGNTPVVNGGVLGGANNNGLGPSGMNSNNDFSDAALLRLSSTIFLPLLLASSALAFW